MYLWYIYVCMYVCITANRSSLEFHRLGARVVYSAKRQQLKGNSMTLIAYVFKCEALYVYLCALTQVATMLQMRNFTTVVVLIAV